MDAPRKLLVDTLERRPDLDLKNLSLAIGRNHAYLQQFLMRGSPRELPEAVRHGLAPLLGVSSDDLRSTTLPASSGLASELRRGGTLGADLPVYASAEGGGGAIIITNEPIDFVRRPQSIPAVPCGQAMIACLSAIRATAASKAWSSASCASRRRNGAFVSSIRRKTSTSIVDNGRRSS